MFLNKRLHLFFSHLADYLHYIELKKRVLVVALVGADLAAFVNLSLKHHSDDLADDLVFTVQGFRDSHHDGLLDRIRQVVLVDVQVKTYDVSHLFPPYCSTAPHLKGRDLLTVM